MKLTNRKIKKLIRESLQRILFESEDRIENLKDQFNLVYQKMSRAKSQEEFDQLNAEAERLDKEINRLTRTMFKEPEEPGEFDFMETEPLQPPMLSRGTEVGAFQDDIDPLNQPAMIDVSDGEGNDFTGGPMTKRDMNRRNFMQNLGVGIGASALLGRQILDFYKDITYEDFMIMSEAEKIKFVRSFVDSELQNMPGAIEYATKNSGAAESMIDDITDRLAHRLLKNDKYTPEADDLFDELQDYVGDYIDELIAKTKDPRLKITSDWFDQSFADGTWDSFIYNRYISSDEFSGHLFPNFDSLPLDEQQSLIIDYVMDYAPEELYEALGTKWEAAGYQDPGETGEMNVYNQVQDLIYKKLQRFYTPEKIKQLRGR